MGFVSDVSRVFVVAVSHGLGPNLLLLFEAFAGGTLRPDFETILRQALYRRYVGP